MNDPARKAMLLAHRESGKPKDEPIRWADLARSREEITMRKKKVGAIAMKSFALLVVLGTAYQAMAQDATTPYPKMALIEQYLMADRDAEIALRGVRRRSPLPAMQRYRFLRAMVSR